MRAFLLFVLALAFVSHDVRAQPAAQAGANAEREATTEAERAFEAAITLQRFAKNLASVPPASALRRAMIETRTDFPDPALWGAFTLFGTPR